MEHGPRRHDDANAEIGPAPAGRVVSFFEARRRRLGQPVSVLVGNGDPQLDAVLVGCIEASLAPGRIVRSRILSDARLLFEAAVEERPDLIVLTPLVTGFPRTGGTHAADVAEWIRRLTEEYDCAVIYIHPRADAATAAAAILGAGATALLGLPVLPAELMRAVRDVF